MLSALFCSITFDDTEHVSFFSNESPVAEQYSGFIRSVAVCDQSSAELALHSQLTVESHSLTAPAHFSSSVNGSSTYKRFIHVSVLSASTVHRLDKPSPMQLWCLPS